MPFPATLPANYNNSRFLAGDKAGGADALQPVPTGAKPYLGNGPCTRFYEIVSAEQLEQNYDALAQIYAVEADTNTQNVEIVALLTDILAADTAIESTLNDVLTADTAIQANTAAALTNGLNGSNPPSATNTLSVNAATTALAVTAMLAASGGHNITSQSMILEGDGTVSILFTIIAV